MRGEVTKYVVSPLSGVSDEENNGLSYSTNTVVSIDLGPFN